MATKTIILTGAEVTVSGLNGANAAVRNDSADIVYISKHSGITAGTDGVLSVPAGQAAVLWGISGEVSLLGTGSVALVTSDFNDNPFKTSAQAGGSGADEVARAAITEHSGNAVVHVTAEEKAAWNGKAELSDIPETLPADGGNAHTVDGKHSKDFVNYLGRIDDIDNIVNNIAYSDSPYEGVIHQNNAESIGLPTAWWHIKYFKHITSGYGCQFAFPLNNSALAPRFRVASSITTWGPWTNFCDGGSAASVGSYTEEKIAALEARIAALEG